MVADEPTELDSLRFELRDEEWVSRTTRDGETVTVTTEVAPNLRSVYRAIEAGNYEQGVVRVEGQEQAWEVSFEAGEVGDVERTDGQYTVLRMSAVEVLCRGLMMLGVYGAIAAVITGVASLLLETPLTLIESGIALLASIVVAVVALVLFIVVPGMSWGANPGKPGEGLRNFERLSQLEQAALVAIDDAKSVRNQDDLLERNRLPTVLVSLGFVAYLFVLAFINFGAIGLIAMGVVAGIRLVFSALATHSIVSNLRTLDDPRVQESLDEIHEDSDGTIRPDVLKYGDTDNPVHENVAMAIPRANAILFPEADAKQFEDDEVKATLAHEYKHAQSHAPMTLAWVKMGLLLVPGIALLATGMAIDPLQLAGGLFVYFAIVTALLAAFVRRWERQADAFASEHASPIGLVFALSKLTDKHIIDAQGDSLMSAGVNEMYASHPMTHRRVTTLVDEATSDEE